MRAIVIAATPHVSMKRAAAPPYKVIRSQLFRFDHNCTYARDFIMNTANLICSMSRNSYNVPRLLHELHMYGAHWDRSKGIWALVLRATTRTVEAHLD